MRAEDLQKVMVSTWKISFVGFFPSWKITEYFYQIISYCMFPRDYFLTSFCVYLVKCPFKEKKDKKEKEEDFFLKIYSQLGLCTNSQLGPQARDHEDESTKGVWGCMLLSDYSKWSFGSCRLSHQMSSVPGVVRSSCQHWQSSHLERRWKGHFLKRRDFCSFIQERYFWTFLLLNLLQ